MAALFGVLPHDLRAVERRLAEVSSANRGVIARLQSRLAEEGAAWGDDEMGLHFANGDDGNGYVAQSDWVVQTVKVQCDFLDAMAQLLIDTADASERLDQA